MADTSVGMSLNLFKWTKKSVLSSPCSPKLDRTAAQKRFLALILLWFWIRNLIRRFLLSKGDVRIRYIHYVCTENIDVELLRKYYRMGIFNSLTGRLFDLNLWSMKNEKYPKWHNLSFHLYLLISQSVQLTYMTHKKYTS